VQNVLLGSLCFLLWHTLPVRKIKQTDEMNDSAFKGIS
jgi:hypothetical protein